MDRPACRHHRHGYASSLYGNARSRSENIAGRSPRSAKARTRFFPPPFRIDQADVDTSIAASLSRVSVASPQNRRPEGTLSCPVKKRRRLLFTSELPPPESHDEDGNPSVDYLRYQSTMRLKHKWDAIYERFKDAHQVKQDEIYLGRGEEKIQIVKDNGVLRALKDDECSFGSFHIKEEDLDEVERELKRARGDGLDSSTPLVIDSSDEDELAAWDPKFVRRQYREFGGVADGQVKKEPPHDKSGGGKGDADEEEVAQITDPDLIAFLAAEARRRELVGETESVADDDDCKIVDFRDSKWSGEKAQRRRESARDDERYCSATERDQTTDLRVATTRLARPAPHGQSDDEMDVLGDSAGCPSEVQAFEAMMSEKRRNVETLLQEMSENRGPELESKPNQGLMLCNDISGLVQLLTMRNTAATSTSRDVPLSAPFTTMSRLPPRSASESEAMPSVFQQIVNPCAKDMQERLALEAVISAE